ncbi:MAG: hypothetical protein CL678_11990 [Bdellovibrionaceae bacterium]|nr:hypothetical protein [Pseudobdellovibrionaceae bacterium]|tara:strand:+ start:352 stop:1260 length:909 start_codon:yes stop_codon:yes gene_type:complete
MKYLSGMLLGLMGWGWALSPLRIQRMISWIMGRVIYLIGIRRDVVRENLDRAFFNDTQKKKEIEKKFYIEFAQTSFEVLMLFGGLSYFIKKRVELRGIEHWKSAKEKGKGVLFLSSHLGNWELMAARGALSGIDLMLVTKKLKPSWFHELIEEGRAKVGVLATYEPQTMKKIIRHLKKGGTVGMIIDQYSGPPVGIRVPVFGIPVGTPSVVAAVARRFDLPVLPVKNYRTSDGKHIVEILPEKKWVESSQGDEIAVNTALYSKEVESHIYEVPEQWLWSHRRFKGDLGPLQEGEWTQGRARS